MKSLVADVTVKFRILDCGMVAASLHKISFTLRRICEYMRKVNDFGCRISDCGMATILDPKCNLSVREFPGSPHFSEAEFSAILSIPQMARNKQIVDNKANNT